MKIKTSNLEGASLDWAVAKCEELSGLDNAERFLRDHHIGFTTRYCANWSQGGPIIEREGIGTRVDCKRVTGEFVGWWFAELGEYHADGETALIAAMRCYVDSKLGDEVDVPEELV